MNENTNSTPRVEAAEKALADAQAKVATAEDLLKAKRGEVRAQGGLVQALRGAIEQGDAEAAGRHSAEYAKLDALSRAEQDLDRVARANRRAVKVAEGELELAKIEGGLAGFTTEENVLAVAAEAGSQLTDFLVEYIAQALAQDSALSEAMRKAGHSGAAFEGLSFMGSSTDPSGFVLNGKRYTPYAVSSLKFAYERAWQNAMERIRREREAQDD